MRKIITTTFLTLDGVYQAPGGPEEDTSSGFKFGGWQIGKFEDEATNKILNSWFTAPFELLLGRITYDIFAGFWPTAKTDSEVAVPFNATKKYVVSHDPNFKATWNNSVIVSGDVVTELKKLKEMDGSDLWVWGSGNLIQTLLKANLIDRMHLWIHPVTIGSGKKLFADGTQPATWKMIDSKISTTGVIFASYEPAGELKNRKHTLMIHKVFHRDGSLWARGKMVSGKQDGFWVWYRKGGTKMRSGYFTKGKQRGKWTTHDQNGRIVKVTIIRA